MTAILAVLLTPFLAWSAMAAAPADRRAGADPPGTGLVDQVGSVQSVSVSRSADALGAPIALDARPATAPRVRSPRAATKGGQLRLTSGFGMRYHPLIGRPRFHQGIDIAGQASAPIFSAGAGVVARAGWSSGYGLLVTVLYPGGLQSRYGHLSGLAVRPGQTVRRGQLIGFVGATGLATGPHLHYEVRINGIAIDPLRTGH